MNERESEHRGELVETMLRGEVLADQHVGMTEAVFDCLLEGVLERPVGLMSDAELLDRISIAQAAFDRLLNEIEDRDLLPCSGDWNLVPYNIPLSRRVVTLLTRNQDPTAAEQ